MALIWWILDISWSIFKSLIKLAVPLLCAILFRTRSLTSPDDVRDGASEYIQRLGRDGVCRVSAILDAERVLELGRMRRFQEISSAAYEHKEVPLCILFISHRWNSPTDPDPDGEQLKAIRFLLNAIKTLAAVYHLPLDDRTKDVKTLKIHGYLQAACILSKIAEEGGTINSSILSRIGIWLDFMCLPQKSASGVDNRTTEERAIFKEGLRKLPSLIGSCDFIVSIRNNGDDYMERAWCISELCFASFTHHKNVVVLREDLLGEPIDESLLRSERKLQIERDILADLQRKVDSWENSTQYRGQQLDFSYADLDILEEEKVEDSHNEEIPSAERKWPTPFFTTPRPPLMYPGHADFLRNIRERLMESPPRNIALLVARTMEQCGFSCSDIHDYARCGLHILLARHSGHRGWRVFFNDCLFRLSKGEPLILGAVVQVEMTDGIDIGTSAVTYRFESDQKLLSLHQRATDIWMRQYPQEDSEKVRVLWERMLHRRSLLYQAYRVFGPGYAPDPDRSMFLSDALVEEAMDFAGMECEQNKAEMGLALLYAECHTTGSHPAPGAENISTVLLNSLGRLQNDL